MKLSGIKQNPTNPRIIKDDKFQKLVTSIKEFPEMLEARPIVVNPDMIVLGGNMRLKAAKAAGLTEAPVYVATWEESKAKEFIVKDNVGFGEWDWDILANEWDAAELDEWGLDVWQPEEEEEVEGLTDPDEVPEAPEEAKTKLGDLYILGEHRLLCGDSTKAEDVEKLMNGEEADMVFTDPPYGNASSGKYGRGQLGIRTIEGDESFDCVEKCFKILDCKDFVFFLQWRTFHEAFRMLEEMKLNLRTIAVWDKKNAGLNGAGGLAEQWEGILFTKEIKFNRFGGNVFSISREYKKRIDSPHPHQKPIELLEELLSFVDGYNLLLDPFLGSGSTLIAAEKTGRKCYGMELDPKYCEVIVKRWEDFTGKKAELWKQ